MNIWTVFKREFKNYFNSPIAYIFMIVFLGFMSFVFFAFFHFYAADDSSTIQPRSLASAPSTAPGSSLLRKVA